MSHLNTHIESLFVDNTFLEDYIEPFDRHVMLQVNITFFSSKFVMIYDLFVVFM